MNKRSTFASFAGLLAAALLAVACSDSVSPDRRAPGRPEFWGGGRVATQLKFIVQPHPNPAEPALAVPVNCTPVPPDPLNATPGSNFATDVEVQDASGAAVNFTGDVTIAISFNGGGGTLCPTPTVTIHLVNQSVAHFVGLSIEQPPSATAQFYTLKATSSPPLTSDESVSICIVVGGDPLACAV